MDETAASSTATFRFCPKSMKQEKAVPTHLEYPMRPIVPPPPGAPSLNVDAPAPCPRKAMLQPQDGTRNQVRC